MKARRFDDVLRSRGYKVREQSKYQGQNVYVKEHLFNKVICTVTKDTHGKAQEMTFLIVGQHERLPRDINEFKEAEGDREYLAKEAVKIHECFEQLKQLKSPKHIYCFN